MVEKLQGDGREMKSQIVLCYSTKNIGEESIKILIREILQVYGAGWQLKALGLYPDRSEVLFTSHIALIVTVSAQEDKWIFAYDEIAIWTTRAILMFPLPRSLELCKENRILSVWFFCTVCLIKGEAWRIFWSPLPTLLCGGACGIYILQIRYCVEYRDKER